MFHFGVFKRKFNLVICCWVFLYFTRTLIFLTITQCEVCVQVYVCAGRRLMTGRSGQLQTASPGNSGGD